MGPFQRRAHGHMRIYRSLAARPGRPTEHLSPFRTVEARSVTLARSYRLQVEEIFS